MSEESAFASFNRWKRNMVPRDSSAPLPYNGPGLRYDDWVNRLSPAAVARAAERAANGEKGIEDKSYVERMLARIMPDESYVERNLARIMTGNGWPRAACDAQPAEWEEQKHPRDDGGRFAHSSGGGGGGGYEHEGAGRKAREESEGSLPAKELPPEKRLSPEKKTQRVKREAGFFEKIPDVSYFHPLPYEIEKKLGSEILDLVASSPTLTTAIGKLSL